jgi:hypothetical protein
MASYGEGVKPGDLFKGVGKYRGKTAPLYQEMDPPNNMSKDSTRGGTAPTPKTLGPRVA